MSTWLKNAAVLSTVVAFTIAANSIANAVEQIDQTCVKTNIRAAYTTQLQIGENRHWVQQLNVSDDIKCSNPNFKIRSEWVYLYTDSIDGSGKWTWRFIDFHEDGSQTYGTGEGTGETTVQPDGSWQANWKGTYNYLGGTGRFSNIRGEGKVTGRASSQEPATEEVTEVVEY